MNEQGSVRVVPARIEVKTGSVVTSMVINAVPSRVMMGISVVKHGGSTTRWWPDGDKRGSKSGSTMGISVEINGDDQGSKSGRKMETNRACSRLRSWQPRWDQRGDRPVTTQIRTPVPMRISLETISDSPVTDPAQPTDIRSKLAHSPIVQIRYPATVTGRRCR